MNKTRIHYSIITEEIETELRHTQKKTISLILRKVPEFFLISSDAFNSWFFILRTRG